MSMGFTFGALVSVIVGTLILDFGWRETSFATGAFLLVIGWGLSFLFARHPADKGLEVDGGPAKITSTMQFWLSHPNALQL